MLIHSSYFSEITIHSSCGFATIQECNNFGNEECSVESWHRPIVQKGYYESSLSKALCVSFKRKQAYALLKRLKLHTFKCCPLNISKAGPNCRGILPL